MPSEPDRPTTRVDEALKALESRIEAFRNAVRLAEQEIEDEVLREGGPESLMTEQALIELGPFAIGRIDPERFAQLLGVAEAPLSPHSVGVLDRALRVLQAVPVGPEAHLLDVAPGGDLRDAVKDALAQFGRAFGAARAVELARSGRFDEVEHAHLLGALPFRLWNRAERRLAPPLIIRVRGDDCLPAGLGEFLDGTVMLVLVADGPTTPAPLARLITPGTAVVQTERVEDLTALVDTEHPAVALVFDEDRPGQACFVHDPDAGATSWARIDIRTMPDEAEVGRGRRRPVWLEELEHLRALSSAPAGLDVTSGANGAGPAIPSDRAPAAGTPVAGPPPADPVDRLAAWLISKAELSDG